MLRSLLHTAPALAGALALGCADHQTTTAPSQDPIPADTRSPNVPTASATQTWERSSFFADNVFFIDCLGENARGFGEVQFQYHEVTTGSGNFSYHFQLRPATPNGPAFFLQGLTSGKLFRYKNGGPGNESFHLGPNQVSSFVIVETFVADDGDRVVGKVRFHVTVNPKGKLTVSRTEPESFRCPDK